MTMLPIDYDAPNTEAPAPASSGIVRGVLVDIDWSATAGAHRRPKDQQRLAAKVLSVSGDVRYPGWTFLRAESSRTGVTYALVVPPTWAGWRGPRVTLRRR